MQNDGLGRHHRTLLSLAQLQGSGTLSCGGGVQLRLLLPWRVCQREQVSDTPPSNALLKLSTIALVYGSIWILQAGATGVGFAVGGPIAARVSLICIILSDCMLIDAKVVCRSATAALVGTTRAAKSRFLRVRLEFLQIESVVYFLADFCY